MNILIAGGGIQADYVIKSYRHTDNHLVVLNDDPAVADMISDEDKVPVVLSDPTKFHSFVIADVKDFDLVIALCDNDADNYVICTMAKKIFGIKRAICTIQDPNNVAIFKEMGIDDPYSASDMLTEQIRGFSNLSGLDKNLALENGKIIIFEVVVKDTFAIAGKSVKDSKIPKECNITCIYKPQKNGSSEVIIPYGDTVIEKDETLVLACARENHAMIMAAIEKTK